MMFEAGDIVANSDKLKGIVLSCNEDKINLLLYDFSTLWVNIEDFNKIGCTYAIYKSMYDLMGCKYGQQ